MNSSQESQLIRNISRHRLDSRIGKAVLSVKGTSALMGERASVKPGHSPVILDYRNYRPGDPLKDIDWKISARTEKIFVKVREGYRQTDFVIAIDGSGSMKAAYDKTSITKFTTALTMAYIAGRVALKSRDRVYISWGNDRFRIYNESSLLDMLLKIESGGESHGLRSNDVDTAANIFLLSDFFEDIDKVSSMLKGLSQFTKNIFVLTVHDPFEEDFDFDGRYRFLDPESESALLEEGRELKGLYSEIYNRHYLSIARQCKSYGAKMGRVVTTDDPFHGFVKAVS